MSDPANQQTRKEELTVAEVANKDVSEEAHARDTTKALSTGGLLGVQGVE